MHGQHLTGSQAARTPHKRTGLLSLGVLFFALPLVNSMTPNGKLYIHNVPISYTYLFVLEELLDTLNIGQSYMVNESNSDSNYYVNNFNNFTSRLTNGIDEDLWPIMWIGDVRQADGSLNNQYGGGGPISLESDSIIKTYPSLSLDLEGAKITSVEFLLTPSTINKTTSEPYSYTYDYHMAGVFTVNGDVSIVPIPTAA